MANKVNTNVKNGDLKVDTLTTDNAAISVDGTLDVSASKITMGGNISANKRMSIGTSGAAKENAMNNTTLANKRGGIILYGKMTGSTTLQSNRGNIEACLYGSRANYTFPAASPNLMIHDSAVANTKDDPEPYGTVAVDASKGNASISFEQ